MLINTHMNNIDIDIVEDIGTLTELRADWQKLFQVSGAPPFISWEWLITWYKWFGHEQQPWTLCAREGGRLVGLFPLCAQKKRPSLFTPTLNRLSLMGEFYGAPDYLDMLALPGLKQKTADLFLNHITQLRSFDLLEFEGLSSDSYTLLSLTRHFGNNTGFRYRISPQFICPRMSLEAGWEAILKQSQRADYFKRSLRRLNKIASFEFRTTSDVNEIPAAFERFLGLHTERWINRGGSSATRTAQQKGFMFDAACEMARAGMVRFEEIWLEGECRASLFGFESGDCYYFYLSGFDQAWSKYSLGFTLLWLSIREASHRGLKMYDFLRGDENYKFDWSNDMRMTVAVQVASDSRAARWHTAQTYAKEAVRAILPDWVKARLRRARKQSASPSSGEPLAASETLKGRDMKYKEPLLVK
ncbi:MAG: hypothetical protein JMDDDDMK_04287 [Acidobacteria bacterium]|nr:hypothetical protein [Acidobacteriota bacterium]